MKVNINDKNYSFSEQLNIHALLKELKIEPTKVAVELNLQIVPVSDYENKLISDGDNIEIVHFIGGG